MTIKKIRASIYVLSTEEGGRKHQMFSGYRPLIWWEPVLRNGGNDAKLIIETKDECMPGEHCEATLEFYSPEHVPDRIKPAKAFTLREGSWIVGRGTVTEILETIAARD